MARVFAFHGGIHPPENKTQSSKRAISLAPIPSVLHIPLQQHIGASAKPCVNVGDKVLKGQRIADAQGKMSVPVHASSSGVVSAIANHVVPHPSGMQNLCISITTDGKDQWIEHQGLADYKALSANKLVDYIRDRGIAGMGGAGFPTALKLCLGDDHIVNTLIINAAECEPYITSDDLLIRERATQIIAGIDVLQHLIKPSHIIIGIEDNKPQACKALEDAIKGCKYAIDVVSVPTKYPSGGEKQLIKLLTNVEVPHGGIPADVGIVCQNIGTVYAINRAVYFGESLISRIVTVTGRAIAKPQNFEALIGTPFDTLLEAAGQKEHVTKRLIVGGPMMGYSIDTSAVPVIKTTNCIIAASAEEFPEAEPAQACIRCGLCEQVCPAQLLPQQLHWFAKSQEYDKAQQHNLFDCIECGACSYVCPSNIPLVQYYRHAKTSIREEAEDKRKSDIARERFEAKQMREQRAIDEKAAKRKERAEQAAKAQAEKKAAAEKQAKEPATTESDSGSGDLKQLKIAAARANTKLKKAQQALKSALEKSLPGTDILENTIIELQVQAEQAQAALDLATNGSSESKTKTATPLKTKTAVTNADTSKLATVDLKSLKTTAAIARTKLKKTQAQLDVLISEGEQQSDEAQQLAQLIISLNERVQATQASYLQAKECAPVIDESEQLQANYDKALALYTKANTALQKAEEQNSPAVEKMRLSIDKLNTRLSNAEAALKSAANPASDNSANNTTPNTQE
ncbi:electron transport complex subunit RsxC [Gammaproteobacteria bacterium AS21]